MRYGDDHVEDDDTDKYDGFETLCRGASDRLGLGWTNRQPNTWAWRAQCRTRFSICCSRTGGARLLSSSTRFLCASVERPHILDQTQQRELTILVLLKRKKCFWELTKTFINIAHLLLCSWLSDRKRFFLLCLSLESEFPGQDLVSLVPWSLEPEFWKVFLPGPVSRWQGLRDDSLMFSESWEPPLLEEVGSLLRWWERERRLRPSLPIDQSQDFLK